MLLEHPSDGSQVEALVKQLLCLFATGNASNRANGHPVAHFLFDRFGERRLIPGTCFDFLLWVVAATAHVQEVDAHVRYDVGKLDRVFDRPAVHVFFLLEPVGGGYAQEQGHVFGDIGAGEFDEFARETGAVFEAAAVRVGALVGGWGEEGVEEVAAGENDKLRSRGALGLWLWRLTAHCGSQSRRTRKQRPA